MTVIAGYLETLARLGVFGRFAGAPSVVAWGAGQARQVGFNAFDSFQASSYKVLVAILKIHMTITYDGTPKDFRCHDPLSVVGSLLVYLFAL